VEQHSLPALLCTDDALAIWTEDRPREPCVDAVHVENVLAGQHPHVRVGIEVRHTYRALGRVVRARTRLAVALARHQRLNPIGRNGRRRRRNGKSETGPHKRREVGAKFGAKVAKIAEFGAIFCV